MRFSSEAGTSFVVLFVDFVWWTRLKKVDRLTDAGAGRCRRGSGQEAIDGEEADSVVLLHVSEKLNCRPIDPAARRQASSRHKRFPEFGF